MSHADTVPGTSPFSIKIIELIGQDAGSIILAFLTTDLVTFPFRSLSDSTLK